MCDGSEDVRTRAEGWKDVRKVRTNRRRTDLDEDSFDAAVPIPVGEDGGQLAQVDFAVGLRDKGN
jgi:hypothetical protein